MDVIDISSDDDEKKLKEVPFIGDSVTLEPLQKKRKLNSDVIILTDEEDDLLEDSNDSAGVETKNELVIPSPEDEADLLADDSILEDPADLDEVASELQNGENKAESDKASDEVDEEEEDDSTKENVGQYSNTNDVEEPPTESSGSGEFFAELKEFIDVCLSNLQEAAHLHVFEKKVDVLRHTLKRASVHGNSDEFKEQVVAATKAIQECHQKTIQVFHEIYLSLKSNYDEKDDCRRLWKTYEKVSKKIKKLELAEVDFDEEDDSAYIKLQRYKERATLIYKKINEREKIKPTYGRIYYGRLDYGCSERPEINRAINRKFQDRHKIPFPSYEDVQSCIRNCVKEHKLKLTKQEIEAEIRLNFEQLGNLIQKRRKQDMASIHHDFLDTTVDPAKEDKELEKKLNEHRKIYQQKQKDIFERFVQLQNKGNEPELSEDSDDSHKEESDEEVDEEEEEEDKEEDKETID